MLGMTDAELIESLGGATRVAELLGYDKEGGVQRVHNWIGRGIPARVKLDHPELFLPKPPEKASPTKPSWKTAKATASQADVDRVTRSGCKRDYGSKPDNRRERGGR